MLWNVLNELYYLADKLFIQIIRHLLLITLLNIGVFYRGGAVVAVL